jgi:hypothetical protein
LLIEIRERMNTRRKRAVFKEIPKKNQQKTTERLRTGGGE